MMNRRHFVYRALGGISLATRAIKAAPAPLATSRALFDGRTLNGWHAVPRLTVPKALDDARTPTRDLKQRVIDWYGQDTERQRRLGHTGLWQVVDGAIVGGQNPPGSGLGAYLLSDKKFADFELELEARPDWPADTGIMVRAHELGSVGFQILLDHRPNGGIGGVFGNSLGNFLAAPFSVDGDEAPGFRVEHLRPGQGEPNFESPMFNYAASFAEFAKAWRPNTWNRFQIRCVGELPVITTWINGAKICELDTATIHTRGFNQDLARERLGRAGHIGFEVHDNGWMGHNRWAPGAVCRWRDIRLQALG